MRSHESQESLSSQLEIGAPIREDVAQIVRVEKSAITKAYANREKGIGAQDIEMTGSAQAWLEDILDVQNGSKDKNIWVARAEGSVIGACVARRGKEVSIDGLYVSPEAQGAGAGTELIEKVFEWAGPNADINLDVVAYNQQAISFYNRFGFVEQPNMKSNHPLANGKSIPMIHMVRKVERRAAA
jgi:ribosomal protein S18 acetylase RimI-like enzyme